jgi:hypothetical protein
VTSVLAVSLYIFGGSLALALTGISVPQMQGQMRSGDHLQLMLKVFSIYMVSLGIIVGALLGRRKKTSGARQVSREVRIACFGLIILWNVLVLYRIAIYVFMPGAEEAYNDLIVYLETIPRESTFLIASILAFFSAQPSEAA